ncbi:MAG: hypothetical protein LUQ50_05965 [Methanospirillum sp.]|uniref:hypothetical protein n=1 Tax=Methanospirillum sp. TaxID=45200 RepID=UPI00236F4B3A|nr:hypothetical protein [Methanospirillum sp.]MDD1728598.1 hypothetical protein [Methanospirillum sp.]
MRHNSILSFSLFLLIIGCCGCIWGLADPITESGGFNPDPLIVLHQADTNKTVETGPVASEELESATLVLTHPPDSERIPYTERNFSPSIEAAIAWWMAPAFMDNTSEFRGYQRANSEKRATFDEEKQIFYNFIQDSLDTAENESELKSDLILFRGISPGVAGMVLNNSEYREAAFASTAYDPAVCLDVFGATDTEGYHNVLVLERKNGEHTLYINEDEREYLIPRGSDWQVVKSIVIDNLTIEADFLLFNRTEMTDSFKNVRLIYITPIQGEK